MNLNKFTEKAQEAVVGRAAARVGAQSRAGRARAPARDARRTAERRRAEPCCASSAWTRREIARRRARICQAAQGARRRGAAPLPSPARGHGCRPGRGQAHAGRVCQHRAPAAWPADGARPPAGTRPAASARGVTREKVLEALDRGARQPARHRSESRRQVPGAGKVRPRPHASWPARASSIP